DAETFASDLLETYHVAVAPGTAFGSVLRQSIRISLASSQEALTQGLQAIAHVFHRDDTLSHSLQSH
ncbi:MAG: hypothetical protein OWS74_02385, partial [Firmicutes bacterium]|nr:hypothetical protein [Bacillota bacterium]